MQFIQGKDREQSVLFSQTLNQIIILQIKIPIIFAALAKSFKINYFRFIKRSF